VPIRIKIIGRNNRIISTQGIAQTEYSKLTNSLELNLSLKENFNLCSQNNYSKLVLV